MKSVLTVISHPVGDQRDDEFRRWYQFIHIPQVRDTVPAITAAELYCVVEPGQPDDGGRSYLCVYRIDGPVAAAARAMNDGAAAGDIELSDLLDVAVQPPQMVWAEEIL